MEGQESDSFSPMRGARAGRRAGRAAALDAAPEAASTASVEPSSQGGAYNDTVELPSAEDDPGSSSTGGNLQQQASTNSRPTPPRTDGPEPTGGFMGVSRRKQQQLQKQAEVTAQARTKYDKVQQQEVMEIPELEEAGKESLTFVVAQAPAANTAATLAADLVALAQADQGWQAGAAAAAAEGGGSGEAGLDLSLLTACLLPSAQVEEADEVWDMGLVFTSVKAALQAEADPTSVAAAGGHQDAGAVGLMGGQ